MAFLVVLREDRPFLRFRLDQDEVSVGRGNAVELYVPDARISRVHFIVRREESGFRLIDRSTNGTFVNGVRVRVVRLKDQDTIIMGGCQIRFERGELEDPATTVASTPEGGVVSYDALQERLLYSRPVLVIRDQEGAPTRVAIRRNDVRIGSSHENDVVVSEAASRHCQLLETSDGFVIRCLDPASSTLVDEQPVRTDRPIPYGSTIRIGRATLELRLEEGAEPVLPLAPPCFESMVGTTPRMHTLFGQIDRFARHDAPLIILGEIALEQPERRHVLEAVIAVSRVVEDACLGCDADRRLVRPDVDTFDVVEPATHLEMQFYSSLERSLSVYHARIRSFEQQILHDIRTERSRECEWLAAELNGLHAPSRVGQYRPAWRFAAERPKSELHAARRCVGARP